jgi:xanthine/CO dehydrogenase XdhC/CoxF family maturation factor
MSMTDLERILPLRRELDAAQADYVLATIVAVDGPSYRKPGACMLIAPDGRRAGTVSGGCLEAQVAERAWWLTANGPSLHRYSTASDDGEHPYGSGCGGIVSILLERRSTASPLLDAIQESFERRTPLAVATILDGKYLGARGFAGLAREQTLAPSSTSSSDAQIVGILDAPASQALASRHWRETELNIEGELARVRVDYRPARPALWIFGAGDDAQPVVRIGRELGWYIAVADGRSHLPTRQRFPQTDELRTLAIDALSIRPPTDGPTPLAFQSERADAEGAVAFRPLKSAPNSAAFRPGSMLSETNTTNPLGDIRTHDAALLLTHSFEQDARILALVLAQPGPPAYIGVLGPQRRTREVLEEVARIHNLKPGSSTDAQIDLWLARLHAPTGLDLGADSPETIALSILAEVQKVFAAATAQPLRELRADQSSLAL